MIRDIKPLSDKPLPLRVITQIEVNIIFLVLHAQWGLLIMKRLG